MRGLNTSGRFSMKHEVNHMHDGIAEDVQNVIGQSVNWWVFDPDNTTSDDIYDVAGAPNPVLDPAESGFGRKWRPPVSVPVLRMTVIQGESFMNPRGFYTSDAATLLINARVAYEKIPTLLTNPNEHLLDRVVIRNASFTPSKVYPKGDLRGLFVAIAVDLLQVNEDEMVNDPQHNKDEDLYSGNWTDNYREIR